MSIHRPVTAVLWLLSNDPITDLSLLSYSYCSTLDLPLLYCGYCPMTDLSLLFCVYRPFTSLSLLSCCYCFNHGPVNAVLWLLSNHSLVTADLWPITDLLLLSNHRPVTADCWPMAPVQTQTCRCCSLTTFQNQTPATLS